MLVNAMLDKKSPAIRSQRATRSRARVVRRVLWGAVGAALLAATVTASMPRPVVVESAIVKRGAMTVTIDEVAKARVRDRYVISSPLLGNAGRIELDPGDRIEPGQVLARITPMDAPMLDARSRAQAEARVLQASAAVRQAEASVTRATVARDAAAHDSEHTQNLAQTGAVMDTALDAAVAMRRMRDAELASSAFASQMARYEAQQAKAVLARFSPGGATDKLEVTAPVSGTVLRVLAESAGVVQPGAPLLEIGDPAALEIVTEVLTADAVTIPPHASAEVASWGGDALAAKVRLVEPSAFTRMSSLGVEEQRVRVILDLTEPRAKWARMGDGFRAEVRIVTWRADQVLQVPSSAVFRREGSWAVFVVDGGRARLRAVVIGQRNGREVAVEQGLAEGERVVVHPSDRVVDRAKVEAR